MLKFEQNNLIQIQEASLTNFAQDPLLAKEGEGDGPYSQGNPS